MKIDQTSPWFLVYTAVASALAVVLVYWLTDQDTDWFTVVLISIGAVVGVLIGNRLRARRSS